MKTLLALCLLVLLIIGLGSTAFYSHHVTVNDESSFKSPQFDHPALDAQNAIRTGDFRLMAIMGAGTEVPGTDGANIKAIVSLYGLKRIEGTGDAIRGPRDSAFNKAARIYATEYNKVILAHNSAHDLTRSK